MSNILTRTFIKIVHSYFKYTHTHTHTLMVMTYVKFALLKMLVKIVFNMSKIVRCLTMMIPFTFWLLLGHL